MEALGVLLTTLGRILSAWKTMVALLYTVEAQACKVMGYRCHALDGCEQIITVDIKDQHYVRVVSTINGWERRH